MRKPASDKLLNISVTYHESLIAPCGMNCGSCIGYMRPVNKCPGCRYVVLGKACAHCIIRNCDQLKKTVSGFCYDCAVFPCRRLKQLDKRYRTRYNTGLVDNLMMIKQEGMDSFLAFETARRKCPDCGAALSVHRGYCTVCSKVIPTGNES